MSVNVPDASLVSMAAAALVCLAIAITLLFSFKKKGADVLPFFVGCAVFFLFAATAEALLNYAVFQTEFGKRISGSVPLLALYGGLMAGIFEETGRLIAFKTVLRKRLGNDMNALQYGAGHGSMEAVLSISITYVSYIVLVLLGRTGLLDKMLSPSDAEQLSPVFAQLADTAPWIFGLAVIERCLAIIMHIGFSVIVWFSVKNKKPALFFLALFLHASVDALTVICSRLLNLSVLKTEAVVLICTVAVCLISAAIWKEYHGKYSEAK